MSPPRSSFLIVDSRVPPPGRKLLNLVQQLMGATKPAAQQAIRAGRISVNGRTTQQADQVLRPGDRVTLAAATPPVQFRKEARSASPHLVVLFEDRELIVVDKPPALLTVPTPRQERQTLIAQVEKHLRERGELGPACCVHRLDRGVSGVLVFAKSIAIAEALRDQFAARKPQRHYAALVTGSVSPAQGTFTSYLATDPKTLQRYSTASPDEGELAITHYQVETTWPDATLLDVWLETGRRNQIRVHCAEAGFPILGDERYGRERSRSHRWPYRRLALHARTLGFEHPASGEALSFTAPLPPEMRKFIQTRC